MSTGNEMRILSIRGADFIVRDDRLDNVAIITGDNLATDNVVPRYDTSKKALVESTLKLEDNDGLVINEGVAQGNTSIAGGTTDKSLISGLVGDLGAAITTLHPSEARGHLSIALGADNISNTAGSVALGYDNLSGGKGYYFDTFEGNTIKLSNTRRTSSLITPSYPSSVEWNVGDRLVMINDERYWLTVTSVDGNLITVAEDIGEVAYTPTLSVFTYSSPNDRTIINVDKPEAGVIDLGWGAIGIGTQNTVVGSNGYTVGYKNIVGGDFGVAFGQENVVGYNSISAGVKNSVFGKSSASFGANNEVRGKENLVSGEENIVTADRSIISGSNNIVSDKPNIAVFGRENNVSSETSIVAGINNQVNSGMHNAVFGSAHEVTGGDGMELVSGWDNNLYGGGYGALIGVRNTNQSGNHNIITGKDNTNTSGNRNILSGDTNESAGDNNAVFGNLNKNGGNNNLMSGYNNQIVNGSQNIVTGSSNKVNGGHRNTISGEDNELAGTNNVIFGKLNKVDSTNKNNNALFVFGNANTTELKEGHEGLTTSTFEGLELIAGNDNRIYAGGYGAIIGSRNINIEGNQNFISGADNTCKGARNILGGNNNFITSGHRNIVSGLSNNVSGSDNLVVGSYHSIPSTVSNALVGGRYSNITAGTVLAIGDGTAEARKNIFEIKNNDKYVAHIKGGLRVDEGSIYANEIGTQEATISLDAGNDGAIRVYGYGGIHLTTSNNRITFDNVLGLIDGEVYVNSAMHFMTPGGENTITLTAEKLEKILKFIDSIEEVNE